jgi:hypothetical protein
MVELARRRWPVSEEPLKAEFDIAHSQDPFDGAVAQLARQGEDIGGDISCSCWFFVTISWGTQILPERAFTVTSDSRRAASSPTRNPACNTSCSIA